MCSQRIGLTNRLAVALVCLVFCTHVRSQNADPDAARQFQLGVLQRIDALTSQLEGEAKRGTRVAKALTISRSSSTSKILNQAEVNGSMLARQAQSDLLAMEIQVPRPRTAPEITRAISVDVGERAKSLADYSAFLRSLREKIAAAPPERVLSMLEAITVPPEVAIVIASSDPGPSRMTGPVPFTAGGQVGSQTPLVPFIVGTNGTTVDYPAVGALLSRDESGGFSIVCTVTLIAPQAVLTARHCVADNGPWKVFFQHAGLREVDHVSRYDKLVFPSGDLAVVFLAAPVKGIRPVELNSVGRVSSSTRARIVGFGWHSGNALVEAPGPAVGIVKKSGIKLHANVTTATCDGAAGTSLICWTYQQAPASELFGSTCHGDSGGPLFVSLQGTWRLAGVTAGGVTCEPGDHAIDVEIFDFIDWIKKTLVDNPNAQDSVTMQTLDPIENDGGRFIVAVRDNMFDPTTARWTKNFPVPANVSVMRVAINATPSGSPLRLEVRDVDGALVAPCEIQDDVSGLSCEFQKPTVGNWQITVVGKSGQEFQLVATKFASQ